MADAASSFSFSFHLPRAHTLASPTPCPAHTPPGSRSSQGASYTPARRAASPPASTRPTPTRSRPRATSCLPRSRSPTPRSTRSTPPSPPTSSASRSSGHAATGRSADVADELSRLSLEEKMGRLGGACRRSFQLRDGADRKDGCLGTRRVHSRGLRKACLRVSRESRRGLRRSCRGAKEGRCGMCRRARAVAQAKGCRYGPATRTGRRLAPTRLNTSEERRKPSCEWAGCFRQSSPARSALPPRQQNC